MLFLFVLFPVGVRADFTGSVVSILDGDTLEVLNGHHTEPICLSGADCLAQAIQKKKEGRIVT